MLQLQPRLLSMAAVAAALGALVLASSSSAAPVTLRLTSITPASAPEFTSVPVTLHGIGFSTTPGATVVSFGGTDAEDVNCTSTKSCTAMAPELPAGPVEVTVSIGASTSNAKPFTYETYS